MIAQEAVTTEAEIIRRCQAGDREAFRTLVEQYQNVLYGTAYLMTGSKMVAEDQVQEAFLSAWKGIGSFRTGHPLKPWLVRTLVNKVLSYRRANSKTVISLDTELVADPVGDDPVKDIEQSDQLQRVLAKSPRGAASGSVTTVFHRTFSGRDICRCGTPAEYCQISNIQSSGAIEKSDRRR